MTFKHKNWQPDVSPLQSHERPFDPCAPVPDSEAYVKFSDLNMDMVERRKEDIDQAYAAFANQQKFNKADPSYQPVVKRIRLGDLGINKNVQRPQEEDHIIVIMANWDFRRLTTARGAWDPSKEMYTVTEGQQRLSALRNKIMRGDLVEYGWNPNDWVNFEVNLEVVNLEYKDGVVDYGPELRLFIQENGEKLPVSGQDKFKAEVHGKIMYSPNDETYPEFERSAKVYALMQQFEITIATPDTEDAHKAGSLTQVRFIRADKKKGKSLPLTDLRKVFKMHNANSKHRPLYAVEVLPMLAFESMITSYGKYDANNPDHENEKQTTLRYMNAVVHKEFHGWNNYDIWHEHVWKRRFKKGMQESKPKDYSLILLLQCLDEAGHRFSLIDPDVYNMYNSPSGWSKMNDLEKAMFKA
jgi:hypothetical protein